MSTEVPASARTRPQTVFVNPDCTVCPNCIDISNGEKIVFKTNLKTTIKFTGESPLKEGREIVIYAGNIGKPTTVKVPKETPVGKEYCFEIKGCNYASRATPPRMIIRTI